MSVTFTIPGKPFAKQRPRATQQGHVYTPKATVSFERTVGQIALQHFPAPIEGAVKLTVTAVFEPAKSWSKKKTAQHLRQPHTSRPDIDNLVKAVADGLNRIAWADDGQIACVEARKLWGEAAHTVVRVEPIGGAA